jgi:hypothetical protein
MSIPYEMEIKFLFDSNEKYTAHLTMLIKQWLVVTKLRSLMDNTCKRRRIYVCYDTIDSYIYKYIYDRSTINTLGILIYWRRELGMRHTIHDTQNGPFTWLRLWIRLTMARVTPERPHSTSSIYLNCLFSLVLDPFFFLFFIFVRVYKNFVSIIYHAAIL